MREREKTPVTSKATHSSKSRRNAQIFRSPLTIDSWQFSIFLVLSSIMMIPQSSRSSSISVNQFREASNDSFSCIHPQAPETASGSPQMRSRSIPISSSHLHRTASEIQLCLDEKIAEYRDNLFYSRVVNGIRQSQLMSKDQSLQTQNQHCLLHIMQARKDTSRHGLLKGFIEPDIFEEDDWAIGLPMETILSSRKPYLPSIPPRNDTHAITKSDIELATCADDQIMIFDMEI